MAFSLRPPSTTGDQRPSATEPIVLDKRHIQVMRSRRQGVVGVPMAAVLLIAVVLITACSHGSDKAEPSTSTGQRRVAASEFGIVLDDTGLHVPKTHQPAGTYFVSFADRRSHRAITQHVGVAISPTGPEIVLLKIPSGARRSVVLLANESAQVVINGVVQWRRVWPLNIEPSKKYPTPAT